MEALPQEMTQMLYWLAFDLFVVAVAVVAVITTAKHAVSRLHGLPCLEAGYVQFGLEWSPLVFGALFGVMPGLLDEYPIALQAVFGLVAGFMSPTLYGYAKRRWPDLMLSKGAEGRAPEVELVLELIDPEAEVTRGE